MVRLFSILLISFPLSAWASGFSAECSLESHRKLASTGDLDGQESGTAWQDMVELKGKRMATYGERVKITLKDATVTVADQKHPLDPAETPVQVLRSNDGVLMFSVMDPDIDNGGPFATRLRVYTLHRGIGTLIVSFVQAQGNTEFGFVNINTETKQYRCEMGALTSE